LHSGEDDLSFLGFFLFVEAFFFVGGDGDFFPLAARRERGGAVECVFGSVVLTYNTAGSFKAISAMSVPMLLLRIAKVAARKAKMNARVLDFILPQGFVISKMMALDAS
jgi:hypothetical protein